MSLTAFFVPPSSTLSWPQFPLVLSLLSKLPLPCKTSHVLLPCPLYLYGNLTLHQVLLPHTPPISHPRHLGPTFLSPVIPISWLQNNWHPPLGLYFWCHNTLHSCIAHATPGPCILVVIVPQLTLCGEAEFSLLFGARPKRAAFLPIMVGMFGNLRCRRRLHREGLLAIVLFQQRILRSAYRSPLNPPQPHWPPFSVSSPL
jgi:hypothetical protein